MEGPWWWGLLPQRDPLPQPTLLMANRNLRDTLTSKGYSINYTEFNGNHGFLNWRGTLASHLIALVGIKPAPKISQPDRTSAVLTSNPKKAIPQIKVAPALLRQ